MSLFGPFVDDMLKAQSTKDRDPYKKMSNMAIHVATAKAQKYLALLLIAKHARVFDPQQRPIFSLRKAWALILSPTNVCFLQVRLLLDFKESGMLIGSCWWQHQRTILAFSTSTREYCQLYPFCMQLYGVSSLF